jgi:hypothetical protein
VKTFVVPMGGKLWGVPLDGIGKNAYFSTGQDEGQTQSLFSNIVLPIDSQFTDLLDALLGFRRNLCHRFLVLYENKSDIFVRLYQAGRHVALRP